MKAKRNVGKLVGGAATALLLVAAGVSQVHAVLSPNLDNMIVFPNPFEPAAGHAAVTFDNLTETVTVRIYKITGELVFEQEVLTLPNGRALWGGITTDGQPVASGIYLYLVTNGGGQRARGKIAVLR